MINRIEFYVPGVPKTAGSKRAFPLWKGKGASKQFVRSIITDSSGSEGKAWRNSIQHWATEAFGARDLLDGSLHVEFTFYVTRPKNHFGKHGLKASAPRRPATRPDALKLARAAEDALTGIIWKDDAQITTEVLRKRYADKPGMIVEIREDVE